jgi:hypothetical protein
MNIGKWKHEEPLELESELETDTRTESLLPTFSIFGVPQKHLQPKPKRPKSNVEKQWVAERRAVWERICTGSMFVLFLVYSWLLEKIKTPKDRELARHKKPEDEKEVL